MENRVTLVLYFSPDFFLLSCISTDKIEIEKIKGFSLRLIFFFKTASSFLIIQNHIRKKGNTDPKLWVKIVSKKSSKLKLELSKSYLFQGSAHTTNRKTSQGKNLLLRTQSPHTKLLRGRTMSLAGFFVWFFVKLWTSWVPRPESPLAAGVH